jgi:hypothetical protein
MNILGEFLCTIPIRRGRVPNRKRSAGIKDESLGPGNSLTCRSIRFESTRAEGADSLPRGEREDTQHSGGRAIDIEVVGSRRVQHGTALPQGQNKTNIVCLQLPINADIAQIQLRFILARLGQDTPIHNPEGKRCNLLQRRPGSRVWS